MYKMAWKGVAENLNMTLEKVLTKEIWKRRP